MNVLAFEKLHRMPISVFISISVAVKPIVYKGYYPNILKERIWTRKEYILYFCFRRDKTRGNVTMSK